MVTFVATSMTRELDAMPMMAGTSRSFTRCCAGITESAVSSQATSARGRGLPSGLGRMPETLALISFSASSAEFWRARPDGPFVPVVELMLPKMITLSSSTSPVMREHSGESSRMQRWSRWRQIAGATSLPVHSWFVTHPPMIPPSLCGGTQRPFVHTDVANAPPRA